MGSNGLVNKTHMDMQGFLRGTYEESQVSEPDHVDFSSGFLSILIIGRPRICAGVLDLLLRLAEYCCFSFFCNLNFLCCSGFPRVFLLLVFLF